MPKRSTKIIFSLEGFDIYLPANHHLVKMAHTSLGRNDQRNRKNLLIFNFFCKQR